MKEPDSQVCCLLLNLYEVGRRNSQRETSIARKHATIKFGGGGGEVTNKLHIALLINEEMRRYKVRTRAVW